MSLDSLVEREVRSALNHADRVVLAVSGGRDSMVLMHAAHRVARERIAAVVTVDHGTGPAARKAAALVEKSARTLGLPVVRRRVEPVAATEDAWRRARWRVLHDEAARRDAIIATAHTRDDQAETVLIRILRQAWARGIAGLASSGAVLRPLLGVDRWDVADYARTRGIAFVDDPSNRDLRFLRNRIRLEILPALERAHPGFTEQLLATGERAARWRDDVERLVDVLAAQERRGEALHVSLSVIGGMTPDALRMLWPAIAARGGVVLDRRGTERLTSFTIDGRRGARIQLSGGIEVARHGDELILRDEASDEHEVARPLRSRTTVGSWRFVRASRRTAKDGPWEAALPIDRPLTVRTWRSGDRIVPQGERAGAARRVKRLLREAGIEAGIRPRWPVVLSGDEIVWVPGVRRGTAATVRSGRPVAVYRCERIDS